MTTNEMTMAMIEQLEEARRESENGDVIIAMGDGESIIWLYGGVDNADTCVGTLETLGYRVVNTFLDGQPIGVGI